MVTIQRPCSGLDRIASRRFGIGNMSQAEGIEYDHDSHMNGLQVDVRPLRKDGLQDVVFHT